jgi:hypothetical protein
MKPLNEFRPVRELSTNELLDEVVYLRDVLSERQTVGRLYHLLDRVKICPKPGKLLLMLYEARGLPVPTYLILEHLDTNSKMLGTYIYLVRRSLGSRTMVGNRRDGVYLTQEGVAAMEAILAGDPRPKPPPANARLSIEEVWAIRRDDRTLRAIGDQYGVSAVAILNIKKKEAYSWVADEPGVEIHRRKVGQYRPGRHPSLTGEQALGIFTSTAKQSEIAAQYGVTEAMVSLIRHGKVYRWATGAEEIKTEKPRPAPKEQRVGGRKGTLTKEQVWEIRRGETTDGDLALKYNKSTPLIWAVRKGQVYAWVEPEPEANLPARRPRHTNRCGKKRFTEEQVRAIRLDDRPQSELADEYGTTPVAIGNIRRGQSYQWVKS